MGDAKTSWRRHFPRTAVALAGLALGATFGCQGIHTPRANCPVSAEERPCPLKRFCRDVMSADESKASTAAAATAKNAESRPDWNGEFADVGDRLAKSPSAASHAFVFETLCNARPCCHHCVDGHVYVSTGMFDVLTSTEELASVIAVEMAEHILEEASEDAKPSSDQVESLAKQLLTEAGFTASNPLAVRDRIEMPVPAAN